MKVDLICEGGGVLGLTFIGAYRALYDYGYEIQRCGGTSAGSIIAALIVAGYTPEELEILMEKTNYKKFMKRNKIGNVPVIGRMLSLFIHNGLYDSSYIECWMNELLEAKGVKTFGDIIRNGESYLKIIASDITKRKMIIIPDDLEEYGINPNTFSIAKAVRMSCNIPLFFTPVKFRYSNQKSLVVDGGLLSIFPIWLYDKDSTCPTIGLKIKDLESNSYLGKTGFFSYVKDLIGTTTNRDETYFIDHKDLVRTIIINRDEDIETKDFKLDQQQVSDLYKNGYECTKNYLSSKTFETDLKMNWSSILRRNNKEKTNNY